MENTSEQNALWFFQFAMSAHCEDHLVNLLKHINDLSQ